MASVDDNVARVSVSSVLVDSLKPNGNGDALSPEEIAWVDSCLVSDPDISDGDWGSMKDALLEIIGLKPELNNSAVTTVSNGPPRGTDIEMLTSSEPETVQSSGRNSNDSDETSTVMEESNGDLPVEEESDILENSPRNPFRPHYREENQDVSEFESTGLALGSSTKELEISTQDIFKVWDLGISPEEEEDELVKELNKALSQSSVESASPITDDSKEWKDLKVESIDDLITGISDLSLNHHSK